MSFSSRLMQYPFSGTGHLVLCFFDSIMNSTHIQLDTPKLLNAVDNAVHDDLISESAVANIRNWLTNPAYSEYALEVAQHIEENQWAQLDDVFWTIIPFGTGGRRGKMYPIGSNAINERTIGESAQGLATYVREVKPDGPWSFGIAYDTRHRSREFAELCAGIMVANDFKVYFIDQFRSTPELSFLVRYKQCDCGIMVTASHNPPSDNAVKVYWSNGAQLIPPHDKHVIDHVANVSRFEVVKFDEGVRTGQIEICTDEVDRALLDEHMLLSTPGPRDLKIIFSPLHGVSEFTVKSLLNAVGFEQLEIYEPHREPDGDFPNVPGHVSNPENPEIFSEIIAHAQRSGAELILASDPDGDRLGAAAPTTMDVTGPWQTFNGNQLGVLLADYVLEQQQIAKKLSPSKFVVTTLVTTLMIKRVAAAYGVRCFNENLVGFKWIGNVIDREGPQDFLFGAEESHGYLAGTITRDKDGIVACLLLSELAAKCKADGITLFEKLDQLYLKHAYHAERLLTVKMEGSDGMKRMQTLMNELRESGPAILAGLKISSVRDFQNLKRRSVDGRVEPFSGPVDNLVMIDTELEGNYIAVRPSGTEAKVKFYMFTYVPSNEIVDLESTKREMEIRLDQMEQDLQSFADSIPG